MSDQNHCAETPLVELLERVPEDARGEYEHNPTSHSLIPYGRHCRRAAARIRELESLLSTARQDYAELLKRWKEVTEKVKKYEQWFDDNMAVLASHRIGGFEFGEITESDKEWARGEIEKHRP